jgi:hypothetical protein
LPIENDYLSIQTRAQHWASSWLVFYIFLESSTLNTYHRILFEALFDLVISGVQIVEESIVRKDLNEHPMFSFQKTKRNCLIVLCCCSVKMAATIRYFILWAIETFHCFSPRHSRFQKSKIRRNVLTKTQKIPTEQLRISVLSRWRISPLRGRGE